MDTSIHGWIYKSAHQPFGHQYYTSELKEWLTLTFRNFKITNLRFVVDQFVTLLT